MRCRSNEHNYAFEIDSENCGVTIDYHMTDWYGNEDLYTEKSLIYNYSFPENECRITESLQRDLWTSAFCASPL